MLMPRLRLSIMSMHIDIPDYESATRQPTDNIHLKDVIHFMATVVS